MALSHWLLPLYERGHHVVRKKQMSAGFGNLILRLLPLVCDTLGKWYNSLGSKVLLSKMRSSAYIFNILWLGGEESPCQCRRQKRRGFDPWFDKIPCGRKWQPTPLFLLGKFHGQGSLVCYNPWVAKSQTWRSTYTHTHTHKNLSWKSLGICFMWHFIANFFMLHIDF